MSVLVTGAAGFTGRRLCAVLPGPVVAATRADADLGDARSTWRLLEAVRPTVIYHLAGAYTGELETDHRANVVATGHLLAAVRALRLRARVLLVGSAAEYGAARGRIRETTPLRPTSGYGMTKVRQTELMRAYPDLDVVMARPFNLYGDGAPPRLLAGRVAAWVAAGKPGRLRLGRLDAVRDYLLVDDAVAAYRRIMDRGVTGEIYNVGSGRGVAVRELVRRLAGDLALIDEEPEERGAGGDAAEAVADVTKLRGLLE